VFRKNHFARGYCGKVVAPSSRKNLAERAVKKYDLSVRHACKVFRLSRTAYYYECHDKEDGDVMERLFALSEQFPTYGYWKLYYLLRDEGFIVNHKKVYRLYKNYILVNKATGHTPAKQLGCELLPSS